MFGLLNSGVGMFAGIILIGVGVSYWFGAEHYANDLLAVLAHVSVVVPIVFALSVAEKVVEINKNKKKA